MKTSQVGIDLIKKYEQCRLEAYKCPAGVLTIGYGHTGNVYAGQKISAKQAEELLKTDLIRFEKHVNLYYSKYKWTQNEFDALVSFAFNIGSITQLTAKGTRTREQIADKMLEYVKSRGRVLQGLVSRRIAERELFMSGLSNNNGVVTFSLSNDGEKAVSKNFKIKEFRCKDGSDKILVDVDFVVNYLQKIRDHFGVPVVVNSAYRTETYNRKVGGAKSSYHMQGRAFDIVVSGNTPQIVARYAQSLGIKGVIQYDSFVHIDSRTSVYHAINHNGKATAVNKF